MRRKVIAGTILGLGLFTLGALLVGGMLRRQAAQTEAVTAVFFPLEQRLSEIRLLLAQQEVAMERFARSPDERWVHAFEAAGARIDAAFRKAIALLDRPGKTPPELLALRAGIQAIWDLCRHCDRLCHDLFRHTAAGDMRGQEAARIALGRSVAAMQAKMGSSNRQLVRARRRALGSIEAAGRSVARMFWGSASAAVLLGLLANLYFYRALLPIRRLTESVRRISAGDFGLRLEAPGTDDLAVLAREFNAMTDALAEARRAEAALREREALAMVGELCLGVAHEVRNPLSTVKMTLKALERRTEIGRTDRERLELALKETGRLERLASDLLRFGRPTEPRVCAVDLNEVTSRSCEAVEGDRVRRSVGLHRLLAQGLPAARGDPELLQQVVVNLLLNAMQVSAAGQEVRVRTGLDGSGDWLSVEVEDDGPGIPPDEIDRVFHPFFTTRPDGTGLGLGIARQIVDRHGGALELDSGPGRGTRARIRLPVAQEVG